MPATTGLLRAPLTKLHPRSSTHNPLHALASSPLSKFLFQRRPSSLSSGPDRMNTTSKHIPCSSNLYRSSPIQERCLTRAAFSDTSVQVGRKTTGEATSAQRAHVSAFGLQVRLSSLGGWTAVFAFSIAGGLSYICLELYTRTLNLDKETEKTSKRRLEATADTKSQIWSNMTGESLPGRPGNLSSEQDEKLRQLWIATLQVFGVLDNQQAEETNRDGKTAASNGPQKPETGSSEKPKRRRINLFGRKHKESDTESTTSTESASALTNIVADPEDKYGQTKQFHDALAHQSPESLRGTFWSMVKHDHPDALLLRFLRARKWDVEKALIMMISTMNWRATEMHVDDDIMKNGEEAALKAANGSDVAAKRLGEDFLAQMRMGKSFLHGTDNSDRPMCFVRARLHKQGEQTEESLERYTVFLIESARMLLAPPIDTACIVFDLTGFSMANMDYSPVKFMIKCFEANYPESLGVVLVHKAPWVFQGIWKIIKGWLDPVVASKVNFTNSVEDLEHFVSKGRILKELGGDEDWSYQYIEPTDAENSTMLDTDTRDKLLLEREGIVKEYEQATLKWIDKSKNSDVSTIKELRHKLAADLRDDYWKLDPYVRARSLYDRYGVLRRGGGLQFYPPAQVVTAAEPPNAGRATETPAGDVD